VLVRLAVELGLEALSWALRLRIVISLRSGLSLFAGVLSEGELVAALWFRLRMVDAEQRAWAVVWVLEDLPEDARAP
jgi:hypothetical protein